MKRSFSNCAIHQLELNEVPNAYEIMCVTGITIRLYNDGISECFNVKVPHTRGLLTRYAPTTFRLDLDRFGVSLSRECKTCDDKESKILGSFDPSDQLKIGLHALVIYNTSHRDISVQGGGVNNLLS